MASVERAIRVSRQLFREFRIPLAIAIAWTAYNIYYGTQPAGSWSAGSVVNLFGVTFFALAWATGQWFRVQKQQHVEQGLGGIESKVQHMLDELDAKTTDLISHITGGKSYPLLSVVTDSQSGRSIVRVEVVGKHSLRELDWRLVNAAYDPKTIAGHKGHIDYIAARTIKQLDGDLFYDARQSDDGRLDIFYSALNGVMFQFLDYRKVGGQWNFASCVLAHGRAYKHIDSNFGPQPDWEAERVRLGIELEHEPTGKIF